MSIWMIIFGALWAGGVMGFFMGCLWCGSFEAERFEQREQT